MKKKFSFIIPALNEEKYIAKCLDSIKRQTKKDYEIIVVDGNSTDNTVKVAKKYADKIIIEKRRGISLARNMAAKKARGEILVFCDADVIFNNDFVERLNEKMKNADGGIFEISYYDYYKWNFVFKQWNRFLRLVRKLGFVMTNGSCMACRKDVFEKINGFNENLFMNEDHDLAIKIVKNGKFDFFDIPIKTSARKIETMSPYRYVKIHTTATMLYFLKNKSIHTEKIEAYFKH